MDFVILAVAKDAFVDTLSQCFGDGLRMVRYASVKHVFHVVLVHRFPLSTFCLLYDATSAKIAHWAQSEDVLK